MFHTGVSGVGGVVFVLNLGLKSSNTSVDSGSESVSVVFGFVFGVSVLLGAVLLGSVRGGVRVRDTFGLLSWDASPVPLSTSDRPYPIEGARIVFIGGGVPVRRLLVVSKQGEHNGGSGFFGVSKQGSTSLSCPACVFSIF